jgi:hypothetical protein
VSVRPCPKGWRSPLHPVGRPLEAGACLPRSAPVRRRRPPLRVILLLPSGEVAVMAASAAWASVEPTRPSRGGPRRYRRRLEDSTPGISTALPGVSRVRGLAWGSRRRAWAPGTDSVRVQPGTPTLTSWPWTASPAVGGVDHCSVRVTSSQ